MSKSNTSFRPLSRFAFTAAAAFVAVAAFATWQMPAGAAEEAVVIPAPSIDEKPSAVSEKAIFAGGCFWGVQGVFQHVKGVTNAVSGYSGGDKDTAHYEMVGTSQTGHAETVEVTYDPSKVTYGQLLQVFFSVAHNPTQLNYQGPDHGTQYRSTDLRRQRRAEEDRAELHRRARQGQAVSRPDRHHAGAVQGLLPGRGLPSGFPDAQSDLSLHRLQRPAEGGEPEAAVPRPLPREAGAGAAGEKLTASAREFGTEMKEGAAAPLFPMDGRTIRSEFVAGPG